MTFQEVFFAFLALLLGFMGVMAFKQDILLSLLLNPIILALAVLAAAAAATRVKKDK